MRLQQALIAPQPWTKQQPSATSAVAANQRSWPTILSVPGMLHTPFGDAVLDIASGTYVLSTPVGPYAVGIVREVPKPKRPVVVYIDE